MATKKEKEKFIPLLNKYNNVITLALTIAIICLTVFGIYSTGYLGNQQNKIISQQTQLLNQSVIQGEPNIIPTGYCSYEWQQYAGYNQIFSLIDIGKTPGIATLSYNGSDSSGHFSIEVYQNNSVGSYTNNTIIQVIPNVISSFEVQGSEFPSIYNRSFIKYSIKIKTNGTTAYGTYFNSCYILTCAYTNSTSIIPNNNIWPDIFYLQIKEPYLYNATYDNGYYYSSNETWIKQPSNSCR